MASIDKPSAYPGWVRFLLAFIALLLLSLTFKIMSALSAPSQMLNAYVVAANGPKQVQDLQKLGILNIHAFIYLQGPIINASDEKSTAPVLNVQTRPIMPPAIYSDTTGAVEVMASIEPMTAKPPATYRFKQPLHMLGWRGGETAFQLYAVGESQAELLALVSEEMGNWKTILFAQGLLMIFIIFIVFWLLNLAVLSTPLIGWIQVMIANVIFLVLFYSVLLLANYPLLNTLWETVKILFFANAVFVPLVFFLQRRKRSR